MHAIRDITSIRKWTKSYSIKKNAIDWPQTYEENVSYEFTGIYRKHSIVCAEMQYIVTLLKNLTVIYTLPFSMLSFAMLWTVCQQD